MGPFARTNSTVVLSCAPVLRFLLPSLRLACYYAPREFVSPHLEARNVVHVYGDDHYY